jgi:hypothetical protein
MIARMSGSSKRADMFVDPEDDPREGGASLGDERATLVEYLRCQRLTLELKCSGLDAADLARGITGDTPDQGKVSLREVLVHMVEEYARHNGHADLLRERIDGRVGQ